MEDDDLSRSSHRGTEEFPSLPTNDPSFVPSKKQKSEGQTTGLPTPTSLTSQSASSSTVSIPGPQELLKLSTPYHLSTASQSSNSSFTYHGKY